jgi:hypothetical protein
MIGRGNRSTIRKPAPVPLCPPQTPHAARTRTRAAAVGSQRLTAELRHGRMLTSLPTGWLIAPTNSQAGGHLTPTSCSSLTDWQHLPLVPLINSWHRPHRKHRYSLWYFNRFRGNMFLCQAVTQQRLFYIHLSRCRCPATGLHATVCKTSRSVRNTVWYSSET